MAELTGRTQIFTGNTTTVDTVQQYPFGTRAFDPDGNEYIYLTGIGSTILGSWVTYDELGITALLVADAIGLVAVAMAIIDSSSKFGWYAISGTAEAAIAANCAAEKLLVLRLLLVMQEMEKLLEILSTELFQERQLVVLLTLSQFKLVILQLTTIVTKY